MDDVTTRSATVTVISNTTSALRHRWRTRSDPAIERNGLTCSRRVSYNAGARPAVMPVSSVMTAVWTSTRGSIDRSKNWMSPPRRTIHPRSANVTHTPRMPPSVATSTDSVSSERTIRPRLAPIDGANRDLVLARRPLRDHQDGDVRARDEERQQTEVPRM